ncbi:NADH dehydrogenase 10.5K chain [Papiliotrema laurentii]|uniref:NADH dehydrogenase 10.5K chain n=1 Tax=Papiliotrema laurentii TaxID=5418 RepID=A0AAD9CXG1_PAPLA|nr:NADH dehydrogenase 10.5K chain [Papiliotrema laurentii]
MSFAKQLPRALKEIRLHLCQTGHSSEGLRQFIATTYPAIKDARPDLKVLIREANGIEPRAFARFERGVEAQTNLSGLSEKDVSAALSKLVSSQPGASA